MSSSIETINWMLRISVFILVDKFLSWMKKEEIEVFIIPNRNISNVSGLGKNLTKQNQRKEIERIDWENRINAHSFSFFLFNVIVSDFKRRKMLPPLKSSLYEKMLLNDDYLIGKTSPRGSSLSVATVYDIIFLPPYDSQERDDQYLTSIYWLEDYSVSSP